jgi:hypothetical protein
MALTATPGTAGPNRFVARVTDYDSGQVFPAQRVALRFTLPDRPEISGRPGTDPSRRRRLAGHRQPLSIDGRWSITALVQGPGAAVTVPLQPRTRTVEPKLTVSRAPGQPDLYTITAPNGGSVQAYVDPGRPGPNTMTTSLGRRQSIDLQLLAAGHFAANLDLPTGQVSFTINAAPAQGPPITASFSQQIK